MKKTVEILMGIILVITMIISSCPQTYAKANPTLDDIINMFNICKLVKKCNQEGTKNLAASRYVDGEKTYLRVCVTDQWNTTNLDYEFSSNVLTADYVGDNTTTRRYWEEVTEILVECISQFHGYAEGEMLDTLKAPGIVNYTLAEQGLRIETNSDNSYYAQIDVTKIIPLIDTNSFIKEEDLKDIANQISGDGVAKYKKGNVIFYKCTINDKDIITIGELEDFSYKIDKSIFNILKVMFGSSQQPEYFKTNYPTVDVDKQFKGFTVEVNPIKNDTEQHVFAGETSYKFVRIVVDRTAVNEALNPTTPVVTPTASNTEASTTSSSTTNGSGTNGTLPKTGKEVNWTVISLYGVFAVAILGSILVKLNKKEA